MCGFFCAVTFDEFVPEAMPRFITLTDAVAYRGPNDSGYLALNTNTGGVVAGRNFDVFLGNRRLAIFDLSSAGHQPMTDGQGRWITYNGEIFNYIELREELRKLGHQFKTGTDTEVILHVYAEYGEEGFNRLNGMWAFALVDLVRHRVIISRDRFSIKPLYLYDRGRQQFFASEIKQLLPLLDKRELDHETMSAFLRQGLLDYSESTFFKGIQRVPPRANLVIDLRAETITRTTYWDYQGHSSVRTGEIPERFRELFFDSVRMRLRSDVKVGVLLSGGIDSSAIAVAANQFCPEGVLSYSIISRDPLLSEEKYVDLLSSSLRFPSRKHLFEERQAAGELEAAIQHSDEPFTSFSVVAQYAIFQSIKRETDLTVLLSGQGGDEGLLGYLKFFFFYLKNLASSRRFLVAFREVLHSAINRTVLAQFRFASAKRYLPLWSVGKKRDFVLGNSDPVPVWAFRDLRCRQIADLEHFSVPALTHYEDRNAMAHSLEVRHPFLDHRLVEFALQLPDEWKIRDGWTKYVLRASLHELPEKIRWRKDKVGFVVPEKSWLQNSMRRPIQDMFRNSMLAKMGVIDESEFLSYYNRFLEKSSYVDEYEISRTLIAEIWSRRFFAESEGYDSGLFERSMQTA